MLQYGTCITQADDSLKKVDAERIFRGITSPKLHLRQQVERLRRVRAMDPRQYARLKKELPYFVCGIFHPPVRRKEHFSAIRYFMVDLDHFAEAELDLEVAFAKMRDDPRLVMAFRSPGGDGLKLMFQLAQNCLDAALYSLFYKAFIGKLAAQYGLERVIDTRTHDVTRACFLSVDEQAFFRPEAEAVILTDYFDPDQPNAQRSVRKAHRELKKEAPERKKRDVESDPLTDEVLLKIRQKLNPNFRPRPKKQIYVPQALNEQMEEVRVCLEALDMTLQEVVNINYGKKLRVGAGTLWAEVNIFFGKRGFSIVKTPRVGSNAELAEMVYQVLYELLIGTNDDTHEPTQER